MAQAAQAQRVGLWLMRAVAKHLTVMGKATVRFEVLETDVAARRFYAGLGGVEGPVFQDVLVSNPVPVHKVIWNRFEKIFLRGEKS